MKACWRKAEEKITKPALGQQANRHHNILPDGILVLMLLLPGRANKYNNVNEFNNTKS